MIVVGRPINGISVNGLEYLMEDENNEKLKEFTDVDEAKSFLRSMFAEEVTDEDLEESFFFVDTKDLIPVESTVNSDDNETTNSKEEEE